ncbi:MAG: hypothetical protein AAB588_04275 [Patescibacteria group bacterium]
MSLEQQLIGVIQGPIGSEVRKHPYGINNADPHDMYSAKGQAAIEAVTKAYRNSGATIGVTATHRLTSFRISGSKNDADWDPEDTNNNTLRLSSTLEGYNVAAVRIARSTYGTDIPIGASIAPITDTLRRR